MMVTFVSQCEKKALNRTRRVLDAFADRIGDNTWQTVITQEGLLAVKKLLRKTASKNTAVSCHWLRSRSRSELVWVVGNRSKFDLNGRVPVNLTKNYSMKTNLDADWNTAPVIGLAAAIAGLFHDVGKANKLFQAKLNPKRKTKSFEPYRHEWVSLRIFEAFVAGLSDREWLQKLLVIQPGDETAVLKNLRTDSLESHQLARQSISPFATMAPFAQLIAWLVVSHHRLPKYISSVSDSGIGLEPDFEYAERWRADRFNWYWNSRNAESSDLKPKAFSENWSFPNGTPIRSKAWCSKAQEIAKRAIRQIEIEGVDKEWLDDRFTSHIARLVLMLSDHVYSAGPAKMRWQDKSYRCYANTERKTGEKKQKLDEHNIGVAQNAYLLAKGLSSLKRNLPSLGKVKPLEKGTNIARFRWQNRAYDLATGLAESSVDQGFFGVNMASTGCGKTIANARIMYALADKRLGCRVSIALGLRTLTQQTSDALSEMLSLGDDDIAVMIGSQAVKELHKFHQDKQENQWELSGSASAEKLIPENQVISYAGEIYDGLLKSWLEHSPKLTQLISAPVLVSTIDHLMPATEGERGGRQIAPLLRLLTSDLILDEPDDFDQADIPALCRLVNFAGVFGSRVLISSATLPPAIVEGLFDAYRAGREQYNRACGEPRAGNNICCAWFDELSAPAAVATSDLQSFRQQHAEFVDQRKRKLAKQPVKRIGALLSIDAEGAEHEKVVQAISEAISQKVHQLHAHYAQAHPENGEKVSIGLVRMANINPMVAVAQNFLATLPPDDCVIHFCIYHSRHPLLVRSHMEHVLDQALTRHDEAAIWQVPAIAQALQSSPKQHHIFVVFATAVAEVGRDHDYDWAIAEPSSMRSLIQLAGRVWRHRDRKCEQPNLLILDSNYRGLRGQSPAFQKPGFESTQFSLHSKNLKDILPAEYFESINAGPRITAPVELRPEEDLVHLEHAHLQERVFGERGLVSSNAAVWWRHELSWSSELQRRTRFRASRADDKLVLYTEDEHDEPVFSIDADSETLPKPIERSLHKPEVELAEGVRPWMDLSVKPLLEELVETQGISWGRASRIFTELRIEQGWEGRDMCYVPDFGVYRKVL